MKKKISCLVLASMLAVSIPVAGQLSNGMGAVSAAADNVFVSNGKTEYKIVYDKEISNTEYQAITECTELMYEATGIVFEMVTDEEATWSESAKYICLGSNKYSEAAGVTVDKAAVGSNGYHVETKGNSAFILGGGDWGTVWGVYEFFEAQLGYECYFYDELVFDEAKCISSNLVSMNMNERPDYEWRIAGDGEGYNSKSARIKMRMHDNYDTWATNAPISYGHTFFRHDNNSAGFVPYKLRGEHPTWFSDAGDSLCFTRDPEGLADQVVKSLGQLISDVGETDTINANFSQLDGPQWCYCTSCCAVMDQYGGANAATQVLFMKNYLSPRVEAYVQANCPEKDVKVYMYAYWGTKQCPLVSDDQIEELKLPSNMGVQYCTGFPDRRPVSVGERDIVESWRKISDNFAIYDYAENFGAYLYHFDDYNKLQDNIQYLFEIGGNIHYNLMCYGNLMNSDWSRLHLYLEANLLWDVHADVNELTEKFFDHYYKDAAPYMKDWFYTYRSWSLYYDSDTIGGALPLDFGQCQAYAQLAEKAFNSILPYKFSNPDLYDELYERINLETMVYRFNMLNSYQHAIEDLPAYVAAFKADCAIYGIQKISEFTPIDTWYNQIGVGNL